MTEKQRRLRRLRRAKRERRRAGQQRRRIRDLSPNLEDLRAELAVECPDAVHGPQVDAPVPVPRIADHD